MNKKFPTVPNWHKHQLEEAQRLLYNIISKKGKLSPLQLTETQRLYDRIIKIKAVETSNQEILKTVFEVLQLTADIIEEE